MPASKRVFISDVHLGPGGPHDWYRKKEHEAHLLRLFKWILDNKSEVKDLVLLGDLFDQWVWPMGETPPPMEKILENNRDVVKAIKECVAAIPNVFFVPGNHDMHVTQNDLEACQYGGKRVQIIERYHAGLLYAEHGSRFAMFNAPDRLHDPKDALPLGYFITRILTGTKVTYDKPSAISRVVDDLLEAAFTTQTIAQSVIETLMEQTGRTPDSLVMMPRGRPDVRLGDIQKKYAPLFERWKEKFGYWYALQSIRAEVDGLGWFADRLCRNQGFKVVVMGHTHEGAFDKDSLFSRDRVYVNSGYWCSPKPTAVIVDKRESGKFGVSTMTPEGDDLVVTERATL